MSEIQNKIEKLKTIQESMDVLTDSLVANPVAKESTIITESQSIKDKIDNIKLPEVDLSSVAKQGENQEATLSAVLEGFTSLDLLIRESVLKENVTIKLTADTAVNWTDYRVSVTIDDIVSAISITYNGDCAFSVPIGKNYSVQLPVIGAYIAPEKQSFIAVTTNRVVNFDYISIGVFGMDELGKRYSKEEIELLTDKSIIKYCGYADNHLANSLRVDGSIGNIFVWEIDSEFAEEEMQFASANVEFSQELLPLISNIDANQYCDGVAYTNYILSEGIRLGVNTPAASYAVSQKIKCGNVELQGHLPSPAEGLAIFNNATLISDVYNILGKTSPWKKNKGSFMVSMQGNQATYQAVVRWDYNGIGFSSTFKNYTKPVCVVYRV